MRKIIFDTNIWIAYKPISIPKSLLMPAVVMQELVAGAPDAEAVKRYEAAWKEYEKEGKLLVPTGEDWWQAGKVINALLRGLKVKAGGKTPRLHPDEKQRIVRDVLIARIARRSGALLVTDNIADFERIHSYCRVRLTRGTDFFS